ncbi:MAG: Asp-tRNA(Asn)/Glu-tRNA(Gln) amidotransferase subunit GatB [Bacteroidetes bacterium]|nr:Asp-tRNA(Asn)/Glu-tRNA(Gln) amidotransferase subunit GatB [Bacteroidota bacterium]
MPYEPVIGLEIHVQLLTKSKAYCSDNAEYGGLPNTQVSPISLGHPGTLPFHNKLVIDKAITMGLALNSEITSYNQFDRKNYFYADLPKGYQITQDKTPICRGGFVTIKDANGNEKHIGVTRIHMEEDSGKSMHDQDLTDTLVDFNRAGVPLVELVSEPDLRSADEAYQYVTEIRKLVRYLGICDGNMEEGSLRCDANVSIREIGTTAYGTKVEIKNMNSISNVKRAIESEIERQIQMVEKGESFTSETRGFNALKGTTFSLRSKEAANDYRYFPEPDLPPFIVTDKYLENIRTHMPALPKHLYAKLKNDLNLTEYDAVTISDDKHLTDYFLQITEHTHNYKAAANWTLRAVKSYLNECAIDILDFKLPPIKIAELIQLIDEGKLSNSAASQTVFPELVKNQNRNALEIAETLNVIQTNDTHLISGIINEVLAKYPEKVEEYKAGKKGLLGLFVGEVMKASKGKADPKVVNIEVVKALDNN